MNEPWFVKKGVVPLSGDSLFGWTPPIFAWPYIWGPLSRRRPAAGFDEKQLMADARYKLSAALQVRFEPLAWGQVVQGRFAVLGWMPPNP